jgi:ATP-dependent Lon protease
MEIIELSSYTEIEKFNIAREHLIKKQISTHGLDGSKFSITDDGLMLLIRSYTREAGVRQLDRLIGTLVRKSIKMILGDKIESVEISEENVTDFLGKVKYTNTKSETEDQVGVVTGLAYTQFGGDTLPVEVTYYKGTGKLMLTGKLGDVMKESAQAALSYVKSNSDKYKIDPGFYNEHDIHIHVPEGAVPKDGPSAGVTITTAIVSALTDRKVDHFIGMTGEITLRGRILPIGGLKEKSIAAHRSGLKTIMIPKDNKKDLEDIPQDIKDQLEIIPVSTIDEIIEKVLK